MSTILEKLNPKQKNACEIINGPVIVMAGAGTGKTRVLTHRIAYLIENGIEPENILAVTFTNKAAKEMKERVQILLNDEFTNVKISTFHSFCLSVLRNEIFDWSGYREHFSIIDEDDSKKLIKEILRETDVICSTLKDNDYKKLISQIKNKTNLPILTELEEKELKRIYKTYNALLLKDNLMDFDDIILNTLKLFNEAPDILKTYENTYKYVMVDEFQDTNTTQYMLIHQLCKNNRNVFVVGDQDQSIYSFRGAKVENIDLYLQDFAENKMVILEENYRSSRKILNLANIIIKGNKNRVEKNLFSSSEINVNLGKPKYANLKNCSKETDFIAEQIENFRKRGCDLSNIAILYRSNYLSRGVETKLREWKIPYVIYGGISYFARKEIKDLMAYIKLAINNKDDYSLKRIINTPSRKIGPKNLKELGYTAIEQEISMFEAINFMPQSTKQQYKELIKFRDFIFKIYEFIISANGNLESVVNLILDDSGYKNMLIASLDKDEAHSKLQNLYDFKTILLELNKSNGLSNVEKLTEMLEEAVLQTEYNEDSGTSVVKLMTYHAAKGLEFDHVFMMAMEEKIFPSLVDEHNVDLEEERRICYVGITRAKKTLFLTNAYCRKMFGTFQKNEKSRFINEMPYDSIEKIFVRY